MRYVLALGLFLSHAAAFAQDAAPFRPFSPISGPNDSIPSPVCDLVNFGFCPQPPAPALPLPDEHAEMARPPSSMTHAPRHHRRHRTNQDG